MNRATHAVALPGGASLHSVAFRCILTPPLLRFALSKRLHCLASPSCTEAGYPVGPHYLLDERVLVHQANLSSFFTSMVRPGPGYFLLPEDEMVGWQARSTVSYRSDTS